VSTAAAVTVQTEADILPDGSAFLWVEGEDFLEGANDPVDGWMAVSSADPVRTTPDAIKGDLDVLPADTNASGGAGVWQALTGGGDATWDLQFAFPATYYLYVHLSLYNRDQNTNYLNEDSFYVPPAFGLNSRSDWIDFEGVDEFGDPKTGDSDRDGYIDGFASFYDVMSAGETETHNSTDEDFWDGQFHWLLLNKANDMDENGTFLGFSGMGIQYEVTDADVGTVLDFQISSREPYSVIDGFLFSTNNELLLNYTQEQLDEFIFNRSVAGDFNGNGVLDQPDIDDLTGQVAGAMNDPKYDLNADAVVNEGDIGIWVKNLFNSWIGDANLDHEFNSTDLVDVLASGSYEANTPSVWTSGDFNGDGRTNSGDLIVALADGGYELGPPPPAAAVPEPSGLLLLLTGALCLRRRP
jgi:hypothetical protein